MARASKFLARSYASVTTCSHTMAKFTPQLITATSNRDRYLLTSKTPRLASGHTKWWRTTSRIPVVWISVLTATSTFWKQATARQRTTQMLKMHWAFNLFQVWLVSALVTLLQLPKLTLKTAVKNAFTKVCLPLLNTIQTLAKIASFLSVQTVWQSAKTARYGSLLVGVYQMQPQRSWVSLAKACVAYWS